MKKDMPEGIEAVFYVSWMSSEARMGMWCDGCSLHMTSGDYERFMEKYWRRMPKESPEEYSKPAGFPVTAYVSKRLSSIIRKNRNGLRLYEQAEETWKKSGDLVLE